MSWPETSTMTTHCGSSICAYCAARPAPQTPITAIRMVIATSPGPGNNPVVQKFPLAREADVAAWFRVLAHAISNARTMAPMEPHVPGALGKYPRPNQVASRSEMCGLGPRVECAVFVSVNDVIASRVSQHGDQSQI